MFFAVPTGPARRCFAGACLGVLLGHLLIAAETDLHLALSRSDPAWPALLKAAQEVSLRDARGNTPLHLAALRGNADAVDALLAHGADANAANEDGATPLHYGADNERMVRALLKHGAKVNVTSKAGVTPLLSAVNRENSVGAARLLLDAGADPKARIVHFDGPYSVLAVAVSGGDPRTVKLLIERGAEVNVKEGTAPLASAAYTGDVEITKLLLTRGADVNYDSGFAGSALNFAFYAGHRDIIALLLEHGADVNFKSPMGYATPPIIWSAYNETGDATFARLLVKRGVDVNTINDAGETALSYALKSGSDTPLVRFLRESGTKTPAAPQRTKTIPNREVPAPGAARTAVARASAQKAVALLQRNSTAFLETGFVRDQSKCISCHQQTLPAVAFGLARERGLTLDEHELGRQLAAQLGMLSPRAAAAREMDEPVPDPSVSLGYGADGLAALRYAPDDVTGAMSHYLLGVQRANGSWPSFDRRPPLEDGPLVATAWAVRAIQLFPPEGRARDVADALRRSREWLGRQHPDRHNDRVFQLLGLAWSGEPPARLEAARAALLATQRADGSWTQLPGIEPDAWATGSALIALHKAGLEVSHSAYQRGVEFLLRTQFDDGSWWVRSRTWPFQPHFDGRFPHGRDQWISAAGTAWATMAILLTLDPIAQPDALPNAQALIARFNLPRAASAQVAATASATSASGRQVSFVRDIQPLMERSCLKCHGGEKPKGDFSLASREALLKGGQSGDPAVVPGPSAESHLLRYVTDQVEDLEMPPLRRRDKFPALSADEVALLRAWIDSGAEWTKSD